MSKYYTREEVKTLVSNVLSTGHPVIITAAGTGMSGRYAELGGADMIGIYNSGMLRMDGNTSSSGDIALCNANDVVLELAGRVMPRIAQAPVIAGISGSDPTREMRPFLETLRFYGFSAVMNFPGTGCLDGIVRSQLEAAGLGVKKEIETLALAKELGLYTLAYCYDEDTARLIGEADLDVMIVHLGLTKGGSIGCRSAENFPLEDAAARVNAMTAALREKSENTIVFAHGGPISSPMDTQYIYDHTDSVGFLGASSVERIPIEGPIREATQALKAIPLP